MGESGEVEEAGVPEEIVMGDVRVLSNVSGRREDNVEEEKLVAVEAEWMTSSFTDESNVVGEIETARLHLISA